MAKISHADGATDENEPGYYEPGRSFRSPNVREEESEQEQSAAEQDQHESSKPRKRAAGRRR